jgi:hypothetical protein
MKTVAFALLLMATMAFVVVGCSDNPTQPVSPNDQATTGPGSLGKNLIRPFTVAVGPFSPDPNVTVLDPGYTWYPDGKTMIKGMVLRTFFAAVFPPADHGPDLLTGTGVLEMNIKLDPVTGVLSCWGKLTVTPAASPVEGGVWEISWHGKGMYYDETGAVYPVVPMKMVGHGSGGVLTGMQLSADVTIVGGPPVNWGGAGDGLLKYH